MGTMESNLQELYLKFALDPELKKRFLNEPKVVLAEHGTQCRTEWSLQSLRIRRPFAI